MRRIIVALALFGIIGSANATARPIPRPVQRQTVIIHEHHHDSGQIITYIAIGMIAGAVIYKLSLPKCENGLACVKF